MRERKPSEFLYIYTSAAMVRGKVAQIYSKVSKKVLIIFAFNTLFF